MRIHILCHMQMHDDVAMMHATPMAGSHVHTPREDRFSEPASVITSGKHLDSGGFASWEIGPADLQLCRGSDGRFVELGCGAFGKVKAPLVAIELPEGVARQQAVFFPLNCVLAYTQPARYLASVTESGGAH